jgi:hypothetical protein
MATGGSAVDLSAFYFREPRPGLRNLVWRSLCFFRLGLLIKNVPLPKYSAL